MSAASVNHTSCVCVAVRMPVPMMASRRWRSTVAGCVRLQQEELPASRLIPFHYRLSIGAGGPGGREKELRRNSRLPSREYLLRVVTSGFNLRIVLLSYRIGTIIIDSFLDRLAAGLTITVAGVLVAATHVYVLCLLRSD